MKDDDAVTPAERKFTDSAPPADDARPLAFVLPASDVRARWPGLWWALGALLLPFLPMTAALVLRVWVLPRFNSWYLSVGADYCGLGIGILVGVYCLWQLPWSRRARALLSLGYVPGLAVGLVIYVVLFMLAYHYADW